MSFNVRFTPKFMLPAVAAVMVAAGALSSCNREQKETQDYEQELIEMTKNDLDRQIESLDTDIRFANSTKANRSQLHLESVKTMAAEYLYGKSNVSEDSLSINNLMNKIENEYKNNPQDVILRKLWAKLYEAKNNCDRQNESKLRRDLDSLKTKRAVIDKIEAQRPGMSELSGEIQFMLKIINDDLKNMSDNYSSK